MKTRCIIQTALLMTLISFFAPRQSHATVIFHWSFDQTQYVVGPTNQLSIGATLFNDASSDGPLTFGPFSVGANFIGYALTPYAFTFGPDANPFGLQFNGGNLLTPLTLAPGQGFHFVWGVLTPFNGYAPPGTYNAVDPTYDARSIGLGIGGYNQDMPVQSDNTFQVTVVPEPAAAELALFGIAAWSIKLRKFKNS